MVKIEADSLEDAYAKAARQLTCSVTELQIEIIQYPSKGFLGLFKKRAVIVASCRLPHADQEAEPQKAEEPSVAQKPSSEEPEPIGEQIVPESFVTEQEEPGEPIGTSSAAERIDESFFVEKQGAEEVASKVQKQLNGLFSDICFAINEITVSLYDENTLLIEFSGEDAALLIGKEGYRYKALSYMLFNWINSQYQMQIRLEIAEFLKNQEEAVARYLVGVRENIDRDGRAQTKILDGVLLQIALRELRASYPDKYVAIRSTRDGSKFIIVNDYNEY